MPLSRKKSCIRCRDFKLSCDRAIPACIRCVKREARCVYDGRERDRYEPYSTLSAPGLEKQLSQSPLEIEPSSINGNSDLRLGTTDTEPATDKTDISHMNWARPETYEGSTRLALESFNPSNIRIDSSLFSPCNIFSEQPFFEPLTVEAELSITSVHQKEDRSLMPEAKKCPNTRYLETRKHLADCMLTVIILGQLTSYPKLLVGGYQLPPFIKAPCHLNEELAPECAASGKHQCLPKVLAVCAGLVQMFYSSTAANVACVWDMIYAEAAKLRGEYQTFSVQERLEASQAMTVFLLLQADDLKSVEKNDVHLLLTAAIDNYWDLATTYEWRSESSKIRPNYREWTFRESMRRLMSIYGIIDLVLQGFISQDKVGCTDGSGLSDAPLPCTRGIWEASTVKTWILEYDRYLAARQNDVVLLTKHLLNCRISAAFTSSTGKSPMPDLVHWCKGMDSLGSLLWMVNPLQQYRMREDVRHGW
ncbi:hypothetical protein B0J13DRAFT_558237 [Dactylonectria estremocensis]|uniref:Zn(2)-C6 fungal-type domain-containing protein n=1 Tax=Dactylonectria estremocensis TaxID=1079267 RepID=A0A9P9EMA8_9HYPO|nr:hypothetical protein B0J13DRAFT_558237 [Dactylonectria estremocensis]